MPIRAGRQAPPSASVIVGTLNAAIAHHQAGRMKEADAGYRQVLAAAPEHFDAMHLLGVVALQSGQLDDARGLIAAALEINPKFAAAHNNLGNVYLRLNRLDEALACFERAVKLQPGLADANFNLGNQLRRQGRLQEAAKHFQRAAADGKSAQAYTNLGATLLDLGDARGAVKALEMAAKLRPEDVETLCNLGMALSTAGQFTRALDLLERARKLDPRSTLAMRNHGAVLGRVGRHAEARESLERVLSIDPNSAVAYCNLGNVLRDAGAPQEALERFEKALALDAGLTEARIGRALALQDLGRDDEARDQGRQLLQDQPESAAALVFEGSQCLLRSDTEGAVNAFRRAIALQRSNADAHYQLGNVLMLQLRTKEAIDSYRNALEADPAHARSRWSLTMAQIPPLYDNVDEIAKSRANFARMLGDLDRWFDSTNSRDAYRAVGSSQPFYLAYQAQDNRELLARYGALCVRLMAPWQKEHVPQRVRRSTGPVRVGIASAQLREHSVWNAIVKGWVEHLDETRFELHLFNLGVKSDAETERARQWAHRLEEGRREVPAWATAIAQSDLDVLIYPEIGMDPLTVILASTRLAPVQVTTWGHPETTGLPTIDYFLSGADLEGPDAASHYSERLVMLPHLGVCYEPLDPRSVAPDLIALGLPNDVPLLLCPGTIFKYTPAHDAICVEISRRLGRGRLVFFRPSDTAVSRQLEARLERCYAKAGLRFADCVTFIPTLPRELYFGLMRRAHILLDTPGFSGFNTAIQAIECGLPVVAHEGKFLRGRLASGILRRMGMDSLVAVSDEQYVELAVSIARDTTLRNDMASQIQARRGVLFADFEPVRALEHFLESAAASARAV